MDIRVRIGPRNPPPAARVPGVSFLVVGTAAWWRSFGWDPRPRVVARGQFLPSRGPRVPGMGLGFAALHRRWWRLHVGGMFSGGTWNS